MQKQIKLKGKINSIIKTNLVANLAIILLNNDFVKESIEILTFINKLDLFVSMMNRNQINELFDKYISIQCIKGCFVRIMFILY